MTLTPNCVDPLPHWIQIPAVMVLLLLVGFGFGVQVGIIYTHWFEKWIARLFAKLLGAQNDSH